MGKSAELKEDSQLRSAQLTINNPQQNGFDHDHIKAAFKEMASTKYYVMADEIGGNEGTYHTHAYVIFNAPVRFSTLKKRFPVAHIERCLGTAKENYEYVTKTGKWTGDEKELTKVDGTIEEWGERPNFDNAGRNSLKQQLFTLVEQGYSNLEIMRMNTDFVGMMNTADDIRLEILMDKYKNVFRELEVIYIFGDAGLGKTRYVMEKYGYSNVYKVSNYKHPFDKYKGQDVLLLDEYSSSFPISDFNNITDGYPYELDARYCGKYACYTKVFIVSNLDIDKQYPNVQNETPFLWNAITRRITKIMVFTGSNQWEEYNSYNEYQNGFKAVLPTDECPYISDAEKQNSMEDELPFE